MIDVVRIADQQRAPKATPALGIVLRFYIFCRYTLPAVSFLGPIVMAISPIPVWVLFPIAPLVVAFLFAVCLAILPVVLTHSFNVRPAIGAALGVNLPTMLRHCPLVSGFHFIWIGFLPASYRGIVPFRISFLPNFILGEDFISVRFKISTAISRSALFAIRAKATGLSRVAVEEFRCGRFVLFAFSTSFKGCVA